MNEQKKLFYRLSEHVFAVMKKDCITEAVIKEYANALEITFVDLNFDVLEKEQ